MYEYRAVVTSVVDGDTVRANIDLGCDVHTDLTLHLVGIKAPKMSSPDGVMAKGALSGLLEQVQDLAQPELIVQTEKDNRESFGRYQAVLFVGHTNVNDEMVRLGFAKAAS